MILRGQKIFLFMVGLILSSVFFSALAQPGHNVAVLYPEVRSPYAEIFQEIIEGAASVSDASLLKVSLSDGDSSLDLDKILQKSEVLKVIALGNLSKELLAPIKEKYSIIYGASFLNPGSVDANVLGISLSPNPASLFSQLHFFSKKISTVAVVYQPDANGWLVDLAAESARRFNLTVEKHPVENSREAAAAYQRILTTNDAETHALWLLQRDPTLDEKAMVPDILTEAWARSFIVFSSNPSHVPRGALFSMYPNNFLMGKSLMTAVLSLDKNTPPEIAALSDLYLAVNVRTAAHVGRSFSRAEEKQFDLVFPSK